MATQQCVVAQIAVITAPLQKDDYSTDSVCMCNLLLGHSCDMKNAEEMKRKQSRIYSIVRNYLFRGW